jgi:hypothetical protein
MNINVNKTIEKWLNDLDTFNLPDYDRLPDIDLYMEQLLTYLERESNILARHSDDKQITSSMINNYVKAHIVPSPKAKKYNREQLSLLGEVIYLKQVLSLPEIKKILDVEYLNKNYREEYNKYLDLNQEAFTSAVDETLKNLKNCKENDDNDLADLALKLAAKANAYVTISKRILYLLKILEHVREENNKTEEL